MSRIAVIRPARRRWHERSRGQSLVEFAFVMPVIAILAFAFIDLGRAVYALNTISNAAREGARVAMVNQLDPANGPWQCNPQRPVEDVNNPGWTFRGCSIDAGKTAGVTNTDVTVSYASPPGADLTCSGTLTVGCIVTVTVTAHYTPITPVAGQLIGPMTFTSTSSMPVERLFP